MLKEDLLIASGNKRLNQASIVPQMVRSSSPSYRMNGFHAWSVWWRWRIRPVETWCGNRLLVETEDILTVLVQPRFALLQRSGLVSNSGECTKQIQGTQDMFVVRRSGWNTQNLGQWHSITRTDSWYSPIGHPWEMDELGTDGLTSPTMIYASK